MRLKDAIAPHRPENPSSRQNLIPYSRLVLSAGDCRKIGGRNIVGLDPIGSEAGAGRCPTRNSPRLRHAPRRPAPDNVTTPNLAAVSLRTIRGDGDPSQNMVIEPFVRMGPLPRSPAAEAHGCFMVRTSRGSNRIQGCGARFARTGGLPSVRCSAALSRSASKVQAGCP